MIFASRTNIILSSIVWAIITVLGVYFLININKYINFGIDLVGGTYLTLEVKTEEAIKNELLGFVDSFVDELKKQNITPKGVAKFDEQKNNAILEFDSSEIASNAKSILIESFAEQMKILHINVEQNKSELKFNLNSSRIKELNEETVQANISIIKTRLDLFGAGEVNPFAQGEKNIVVELPNVSDPEKAKERIGKSALLEMKPVYDYARTKEGLLEKIGGKESEGTMIIQGKKGIEEGYYLVPSFTKLTGRLLKEVSYRYDPVDVFSGEKRTPHVIAFQFNQEGANRFFEMTKSHVGEMVAMIIDNVVVSAPYVQSPIEPGGSPVISGNFSEESAKELVTMLKSGAFAAPVKFVEERHIAPTLGYESIYKGLMSCAIGLGLLLIFSILSYKLAGIFAFTVLLYNLLLILFGLSLIPDATLTLPGIAGMVLTVGMAIDSSILIFERIKEELALGVNLKQAIDMGFKGATTVILDANITTFIVGAVLYYFGSPAIQGFALTMMVGIAATLITGLILLKWLFAFGFEILGIQKISF